jgi:hypothetical protein
VKTERKKAKTSEKKGGVFVAVDAENNVLVVG